MARRKITLDEVQEAFDRVSHRLDGSAKILPVNGDDAKCVFVSAAGCQTYSCQSLKGHLEFMLATLV